MLAALGVGVYFSIQKRGSTGVAVVDRIFPSATETTSPAPKTEPPQQVQPTAETTQALGTLAATELKPGALLLLSSNAISSLSVVGTTTRYHKNIVENPGHLFERKADGSDEEKRISNFTIPQILKVIWSRDGKKAVIFYQLDDVVRKILVDYTGTSTPKTNFLPDSIGDVAFSPDSKSLAYVDETNTASNIFIATADFRNPRKIFDNTIPRVELAWPTASLVAVKTKSSAETVGFLYTVNAQSGELKKVVEGAGLDAIWNSDGTGILYTVGKNLSLRYFDIKNSRAFDFGLQTVAEKCVMSAIQKNTAYCGVPKNLPRATYPDAWWQGKVVFDDNIVAINLDSGEENAIKAFGGDLIRPILSASDSYLLFSDKTSGALWSLKLK